MSQQVGLFLNPVAQRRLDFQQLCGGQFASLLSADGTEQAAELLAQHAVGLLVIDLERFERSLDLDALGALITLRAGAPTLLVCPFASAGWLPALMAFGPCSYVIGPVMDSSLRDGVTAALEAEPGPSAAPELRQLLALKARMRQALVETDDLEMLAERICAALCTFPGVIHAAMFYQQAQGDLELQAEAATNGINLSGILPRSERLLQSPLRHAFPGLLAAVSGEMALLDLPAKCGEPVLALALSDHGVGMVLGLALPRGSLCLMFDTPRQFSADALEVFGQLAQMVAFGRRMAEISIENAELHVRMTRLATIDALTGVANRRHGEHLLEQEIKRARRYKVPVTLIGFDIDCFKAVNDQFGYPVGDAALRTVAEAARAALRTTDTLVRSGGAEFMIIAPHASAIDALKLAEKIRSTIASTDIAGCDRLTVSLGVAELAGQETADALMQRVDKALGKAKRAGRNCVELALN